MEMLFATFRLFYTSRRIVAVFTLALVIVQLPISGSAFAANPNSTSAKTNIQDVGMNMYTTAREWELGTTDGYTEEAFIKFADKINKMIEGNSYLKSYFQNLCSDCKPIVANTLDTDKDFIEYIKTPPGTKTAMTSLGIIIARHFHPTIRDKGPLTLNFLRDFETQVQTLADDIRIQVKEQTAAYRDVSGMGLYYDGNVDNSPYDLLDDTRRIDEIFFREAPEFGTYKNTGSEDATALITGQVQSGTWGGGKNYNIDLLSEIGKALGGGEEGSSGGSASGGNNGEVGDCDSGFCITIEYIQNSHYFVGGGENSKGKGKNSFQGVFEEGLDWIIKNGDNRNFACKVSPTINTWESEFDSNIKLNKVFSGASIFVFGKTPPFLKGFFDRNTKKATSSEAAKETAKTKTREEKATADSIKSAFRRYDLDSEKPTNIKSSQWQMLRNFAVERASRNVRVIDTLNAINLAEDDHEQLRLAAGTGMERASTQEKNIESIKHMEKGFDEIAIRARTIHDLTKSLKAILQYVGSKDKCQPS